MKKLTPKHKQKLVYVKWQDAFSNSGWFTRSELEKKINDDMYICEDVGWVVYEDKKELHLVSRRSLYTGDDTTQYGLYQRIPKAWIFKKKVIRV